MGVEESTDASGRRGPAGGLVPPQRTAGDDASHGLHPARSSLRYRTWLRFGVRPLLLLVDATAWLLACLAVGPVTGSDLGFLALCLMLLSAAGLYRSRLSLSALDDLPSLVGRTFAAAALALSVTLVVDPGLVSVRRLQVAAVMAVLLVALRAGAYAVVRRARQRGLVAHPTLVLGAGRVGAQLAHLLLEHPSYGLVPVGFLDSDPFLPPEQRPVPLLGGQEALASIIVEFGVRDVIVAFGSAPESSMVDIIRTCDRLDAAIFFVPRLFELHRTSKDMDQVWGLPLVRMSKAAYRRPSWLLKRTLDVLLSGLALVTLSPVLAAVAVGVRLEGGKGLIFRQERISVDGRTFEVLKFRSMRPVDESESQTRWNIQQDDRLGPVGRFIRSTSLDELPQLWNILRGDMTIVGPRPERPHFVSVFAGTFPRYTARHRVPAGLTGWAQVHGLRGDTSIEERARFDNYYIENWSLWTDVKIVLRTVSTVLRRAGG